MIDIVEKQGRKTLELKDAELVFLGERETGKSQYSGRQWKVLIANIKFSLGTNMEGREQTMIVAAKCFDDICDRISMVAIGTKFHAFVRFDLNTYYKKPSTECTLVDFTL